MAHRNDEKGGRRMTRGRGAHEGPPPYGGARYNPYGEGPTTPGDDRADHAARRDSWTEPKGCPSDTPRPRG